MIADLRDAAPPNLASAVARLAIDASSTSRGRRWQDGALVEEAAVRFAATFGPADRRASVSLWSMYYFAAVILPATAALVCLDRVLPLALDDIGFDLASDGTVRRIWLSDEGCAPGGPRFALLVERQIAPFVAGCAARSRLSPRVLWANAATILDYALGELLPSESPAAAEANAILEGRVGGEAAHLARPYRPTSGGNRERRICCLRLRLPGVAACDVCPFSNRRLGIDNDVKDPRRRDRRLDGTA